MAIEEQINHRIMEIDDSKVYYTLKQMHIRHISDNQVHAIKIFIVLRELGMIIVSSTVFIAFYGTTPSNAIMLLHRLGDKKVLTLITNEKPGALRYVLSEKFVALYTSTHQI